jgi:hypothetical protein
VNAEQPGVINLDDPNLVLESDYEPFNRQAYQLNAEQAEAFERANQLIVELGEPGDGHYGALPLGSRDQHGDEPPVRRVISFSQQDNDLVESDRLAKPHPQPVDASVEPGQTADLPEGFGAFSPPQQLSPLPVFQWANATKAQQHQALSVLADFVGWLRAVYAMPSSLVPGCWIHHPDLVVGLWALLGAYRAGVDSRAGQDGNMRFEQYLAWWRDSRLKTRIGCSAGKGHEKRPEYGEQAWHLEQYQAFSGQAALPKTWLWPND